ncbi:MAG: thermonuclease family protein, partial [Flavobacteriaceae bacterium]|nr:thermonuclease family protein [Flavobacteriaceae bacterium]
MKSGNTILLAIAFGCGFWGGYSFRGSQINPVREQTVLEQTAETYSIKKYVDGDTIDLNEGIEVLLYRIRLLGIDTDERGQPLYREATEALEELIDGNPITLKKDPSRDLGDFRRPLRYIFIGETNINIEMVRLGYARTFMHEGL